eukprot:2521522-Prymnesium_polylepis.2
MPCRSAATYGHMLWGVVTLWSCPECDASGPGSDALLCLLGCDKGPPRVVVAVMCEWGRAR